MWSWSKIVAKANGAPGVVYAVDGNLDNAIKPVVPPQIKQETLAIKNDYISQIDKITGSTNQFLGDIGTAGNTKSGTENAISRATIIENKVLLNIKEFIEDVTEIIIEYIKEFMQVKHCHIMMVNNQMVNINLQKLHFQMKKTWKIKLITIII